MHRFTSSQDWSLKRYPGRFIDEGTTRSMKNALINRTVLSYSAPQPSDRRTCCDRLNTPSRIQDPTSPSTPRFLRRSLLATWAICNDTTPPRGQCLPPTSSSVHRSLFTREPARARTPWPVPDFSEDIYQDQRLCSDQHRWQEAPARPSELALDPSQKLFPSPRVREHEDKPRQQSHGAQVLQIPAPGVIGIVAVQLGAEYFEGLMATLPLQEE